MYVGFNEKYPTLQRFNKYLKQNCGDLPNEINFLKTQPNIYSLFY